MTTVTKAPRKTGAKPAPKVTGYNTDVKLFASRYKQGKRTVYELNLSPEQLVSMIDAPDPFATAPGNRKIRLQHAQGFGRYFREHDTWVVPGMILRTSASFGFELLYEAEGTEFGVVTMSRADLKDLHILDGQHRVLGFHLASRGIAEDLDKARSQKAAARKADPEGAAVGMAEATIKKLEAQRARLASERVSLEIFIEADPKAYKQMFFDIADNALGITASVRSRFDQRRVVNRALEVVLEGHPLLTGRVEAESDRVGRGSANLMSAKHVAEIVRTVQVGLEGRISRRQDAEWSSSDVAKRAMEFFDLAVESFAPLQAVRLGQLTSDELRKTNLLGSVLMVRVLAGVRYELVANHAFTDEMVGEFFKSLNKHMSAPVYPASIWMSHMPEGVFSDNTLAPHGRRQDMKMLRDTLVAWALDKPAFVDNDPAPRPPEPEFELQDPSEAEAGDILRPETARARKEKAAAAAK